MYFSNITNDELQHFHGMIGADFSMSLTDIFNSALFKTEEIIHDKLYRVYPLFYCKNIISSNSKDKILDTRCLILNKNENETYLSFMTNPNNENIVLNEDILSFMDISDILNTEEFNSLVYRLRQRGNLTGEINFEKWASVTGVYGTYEFNNVVGQLRNDTGIIINDRVKNNNLTVKLTNPFFLNANYTLIFTVRSITGANVCEEGQGDFITKDSFTIDLIEGMDVAIPLNNYVNDSVLDFNVAVSISFNVPEIVNSNFNLILDVDCDDILIGREINLTANLNGEDNISNYTIQFFEDNVLIGSESTNNEGIASLTYVPNVVGNHIYSAKVLGLTREVNVVVNKLETTLSVNVNSDSIVYGDEITLTGTLLIDNYPVSDLPVKLYDNNILIETLTTDGSGNITFASNNLNTGNNNLKLVYEETSDHKSCNASITIIVKIPTYITIRMNTAPPIYAAETLYETEGVLYNSLDNSPIANKTVSVREDGSNNLTYLTTNENGVFYTRRILGSGNRSLIFNFNGDAYYVASTIIHAVSVIKHNSEFRNIIITEDTISGYLVQAETGNLIKRSRVGVRYDENYVNGTTTDGEGFFKNTLRNAGANYCPNIWNSLSYDGDYYNNGVELDISGIAISYDTSIVNLGKTYDNSIYTCSGKLVDANNNGIANKSLQIRDTVNNAQYSVVTDSNGVFSVNTYFADHGFNCIFAGDDKYFGSEGSIY